MALGLPRGWRRDTAALYARVFRRGAQLALRNWWVGLVVIVYAVLLDVVAVLTAPLGIVGGLLAYLALVACFSSWLSLVAQVIQTGRIRLEDVPTSFATYFGDLLNVGFLFCFAAIVRGLLFQELSTSSRRGREFWRRAAG